MDVIIEPRITVLVSESVNIEPTSLLSLTLSNLSLILAQVNLFDNAKKKNNISSNYCWVWKSAWGNRENEDVCAYNCQNAYYLSTCTPNLSLVGKSIISKKLEEGREKVL